MGVPGNEAGAEGLGMRLKTEVSGNEAEDGSTWE